VFGHRGHQFAFIGSNIDTGRENTGVGQTFRLSVIECITRYKAIRFYEKYYASRKADNSMTSQSTPISAIPLSLACAYAQKAYAFNGFWHQR